MMDGVSMDVPIVAGVPMSGVRSDLSIGGALMGGVSMVDDVPMSGVPSIGGVPMSVACAMTRGIEEKRHVAVRRGDTGQ